MGQEISTKERKSFVFYRGFAEAIAKCPIEEQLGIYKAIVAFALDGTEPELGSYGGIIWPLIQPQLIADWVRWNNGCHGGPPIGNRNNPNGRRGKGKRTNQELTENQPKTNQELTDPIYINDNDNVSTNVDKEIPSEEGTKKDGLSLPPSPPESNERYIKFKEKLKKECPHVAKMEKQLTEKEFEKIMGLFDDNSTKMWEAIQQLENNKQGTSKNRSVYQTLLNWKRRGFFDHNNSQNGG